MKNDTLYIQWHITAMCNFNCRHCYQADAGIGVPHSWRLLKKIADNIIGSLKRTHRKAVINITGGEPFLHPGFFALLHYLNSFEEVEELMIITNGFLADKNRIKELAGISKLSTIKVSLEGADELSNSLIRPPGTFETVLNNLRTIIAQERFETIVMLTLCNDNITEIAKMFDLCADENIDGFIAERFIPIGRGRRMADAVMNAQKWEKAVKMLLARCSVDISSEDALSFKGFFAKNRKRFGSFELYGAECAINNGGIAVMENGDAYPCRRLPVTVGNLLEQPLDTVLNAPFLRDLSNRRKIGGNCGRCDISDCLGCRALAYAACSDAFAEDKACWYAPEPADIAL